MDFRNVFGIGSVIFFTGFSQISAQTGSILREYWNGISGNTIADLTNSPNFPDSPDGTTYLTSSLEAPVNWNDNYGTRIRGFVHPPVTGNYIFWIASDDQSELWLSTDDKQSNKAKIAYLYGYSSSQEWGKDSSQQSAAIYLEAGKRYYIEVLHKDGTQNDNCAVGWQLPTGTYERPIPATRLSPVVDNDDYSQWSDTAAITINTASSGVYCTENQLQFPLCIKLDNTNFSFYSAASDGSDIRFAKSDGTHLKYHIEKWDSAAGSACIWVLVDTIRANDSTQSITMLWGNSGAVNRSDSNAVFNGSNNYVGVWHMHQDPSASAPQIHDASSANNHCTSHGAMTSGDLSASILGEGLMLDGSDDYLSSANQYNNPQEFTLTAWIKTTSSQGGVCVNFGSNQTGASTYKDRALWMDSLGRVNFTIYTSSRQTITSPAAWNDGEWHHIAARHSASLGIKLFVDGVAVATSSVSGPASYSGYWRVGYENITPWNMPITSEHFLGEIDEVTVSHVARKAEWVKLLYENEKNNPVLLTFSSSVVKPLVYLVSHIAAVAETSLTVQPFSVVAYRTVPTETSEQVVVNLAYGGTAQGGVDYSTLPATVTVTIPADSLHAEVPVSLTPAEDSDDEGNETIIVSVSEDTLYRIGDSDSVLIVITDNDQLYPPVITLEPSDTSIYEGDVAILEIELDGSPPFSFEWRKNGTPIAGAMNSARYTLPQASMSDSGAIYSCIVSNSVGEDTSGNAVVHVFRRPEWPRILRQPRSMTLAEGDTARLSVVVAGSPPVTWQWYCDGTAVTGAIDSVYIIWPVTREHNGKAYYCEINNDVGSCLSANATITVHKPSSQTLVITGDLYSSGRSPIGYGSETEMNFLVKLYGTPAGGTELYSESFLLENRQSVTVRDGKFALQLGSGTTNDTLVEVVRAHPNLFVEFTIFRPGGNPEILDKRVPLTASPYALSPLPQTLRGLINPNTAGLEAPIGTHYLQTATDSTFIKTATGWAGLQ